MANGWQEAYSELSAFIAGHTEVEIGADKILIPADIRPEFYRLFDAVRKTLVEEKFPDLLNDVKILSQHYTKTEQEIIELLHLDKIKIEAGLSRFLRNPVDELARELFNPLFDLLKGKIDIGEFEELAQKYIEPKFGSLFQSVYEKWITLSLLKPLEANHVLQVILPKFTTDDEEQILIASFPKEEVPLPKQTNYIAFNRSNPKLVVPDLIIHSAKLDKYIALRSGIRRAEARASNVSELGEYCSLDYRIALDPGLNLIYVANNPEEISLIADDRGIRRPDLILVCKGQKEWYEKEGLEKIKLYHINLKPKLGTYIISRDEVPEHTGEEPGEDDIKPIVVGFDQFKLEPIINTLMPQPQMKEVS